jgi:phage terminase small subunit
LRWAYAGGVAPAIAAYKPLGKPPAHLSPAESAVWRELMKLTPRGHLQSSDRFFVEVACRLITCMWAGEVKASELNAVMNVLSKLGLNPVDRAKLNLVPARPPGKSEEGK